MRYRDGFKKGSLELLILNILSIKDCYGYEITQLLKEHSNGTIIVPEGSLYPALYKLEEAKLVTKERRLVGKRRERVYYHLEDAGFEAMRDMVDAYWEIAGGISSLLKWGAENGREHQSVSGSN